MRSAICLMLTAVFLALTVSGCSQESKDLAVKECVRLCEQSQDLDDGPCLSDEVIEDWVCDVAHDPRQPVDNLAENQCPAFRNGQAHHFVELDTDCNLIKTQ